MSETKCCARYSYGHKHQRPARGFGSRRGHQRVGYTSEAVLIDDLNASIKIREDIEACLGVVVGGSGVEVVVECNPGIAKSAATMTPLSTVKPGPTVVSSPVVNC